MEQSLSSELVKRLGQWSNVEDSDPKENVSLTDDEGEERGSENDPGEAVNGGGEENPALEGHFLTERSVLDVAVLDSCQCQCHSDQNLTFELSLPFSCSKCSQQFCCKCQFLVHRDFHRGERKYICQVCNKSYYYKSDLVRHQPVHSSVKPHLCKVCGKSFNQVGHLITHRLVHTGEKPFPCDVCHKPFNRKSNLQKHKMIHTGERPFMCLVCGSRFSRKGDLQRHTMLHTGERPYKCDVCDKSFSQKPHLLSHQSVHTGERPYKCLACGKSFNRKSNLIKHQIAKCPALSLKRSDGSDLQLGDLNSMGSTSFFAHFNQLLMNKAELSESEEPKAYFDGLELKTDVTLVANSPEVLSNDSNSSPPETTSLLRARLSNATVFGSPSNAEEPLIRPDNGTEPIVLKIEFGNDVLQKNSELLVSKTFPDPPLILHSQGTMEPKSEVTNQSSLCSDNVQESSGRLEENSSNSPGPV